MIRNAPSISLKGNNNDGNQKAYLSIYLSIAAFTLTGCETLGLPGSSAKGCSNIDYARQNIKVGQTTHDKVVRLCGEPTSSSRQTNGSLQLNYVITREADETTTNLLNAAGGTAWSIFNIKSNNTIVSSTLSPVATRAGTYLPSRTEGVAIFVLNGKVTRITSNNLGAQ